MRVRKKDKVLFLLIGILVLMGVGYAYLNANLSIDGVSNVKSSNWNVHFENAVVSSGSVSATAGPTIDTNTTTVSYTTTLSQPGDYFEFTVDAKNSGTIDAMIDSISTTVNGGSISSLPYYLEYSITYEDGIPVGQYHLLEAGSSTKYKIKINYITDIDASDLPSTDQSLRVISTINYKQADNNAFDRPMQGYAYASAVYGSIGQTVLMEGMANDYSSFEKVFYKVKSENSIATELYLGFKIGSKAYFVKGADTSTIAAGRATMLKAFGENKCNQSSDSYYCSNSAVSVTLYDSGKVKVNDLQENSSCYWTYEITASGSTSKSSVC